MPLTFNQELPLVTLGLLQFATILTILLFKSSMLGILNLFKHTENKARKAASSLQSSTALKEQFKNVPISPCNKVFSNNDWNNEVFCVICKWFAKNKNKNAL